MTQLGNNVEITEKGNLVTVTFDKSKDFGLSKSGKTKQIASTLGNQKVNDFTIGINVYRKAA